MHTPGRTSLVRDLRWPLLVLAVGALGVGTAFVLDQTSAYEYALTVGAPSFWVLAVGAVWLVGAVAVRGIQQRAQSRR